MKPVPTLIGIINYYADPARRERDGVRLLISRVDPGGGQVLPVDGPTRIYGLDFWEARVGVYLASGERILEASSAGARRGWLWLITDAPVEIPGACIHYVPGTVEVEMRARGVGNIRR